jgi:MORN repeat
MTYVGSWRDGLKDGVGTLYFPNGDTLSGRWAEGVIDGPVEYKFHEGSPWNDPEY